MIKVSFSADVLPSSDVLILFVAEKRALGELGTKLDKKTENAISRSMEASRFTGEAEQTVVVLAPAKTKLTKIVLVGMGDPAKADEALFVRMGGVAIAALDGQDSSATILVDRFKHLALDGGIAASQAALGAKLRLYRFDKYRTKMKPDQKSSLKTLIVAVKEHAAAKTLYARQDKVADGVYFARDLINEPANVLYPETMAQHALALTEIGVKVDVLDERQLKKLGMNALLAVGQGSVNSSRLVVMHWMGDAASKKKPPVCFVGKGVTFDTGGISLKPPAGMDLMKRDMAGAAAVMGAIKALAARKAKVNVVGVVALAENMPSGSAIKPGDIIKTASGQTVEVLNTDAEGRLVLSDAMWYAQENFKPCCVVDIATLTGAMAMTLGGEYAGIFSNDDDLCEKLTFAGSAVDERLWRFPMGTAYDKMINSPVADMKNTGERNAGSITAAQFLQRFIKKGVLWAHLDIAGTAWCDKDLPTAIKGATAFGVRTFERFIADNFEER